MYLTHKDKSKYWIIDIETDDLKATKIWCIVCKNLETKELVKFTSCYGVEKDVNSFPNWVDSLCDPLFIGHNAISFDIPTINRLLRCSINLGNVVDTLVLSYLYFPRFPGGHSLESWGLRLNKPKGLFNDFSKYSPEMLEYCTRDVLVTEELFNKLIERMVARGFSERSCKLEHDIRRVVDRQQSNGFYFQSGRAESLLRSLRDLQQELTGRIGELFPPVLRPVKEYVYRTRADGSPFESFLRHSRTYPRLDLNGESYTVYDWETFNIGSPKQRSERLLELGWKPDAFTEKGSPKVDEEALVRAAESLQKPEIQAMADWLVLQGRSTMIEGWLGCVDPSDSCIHGHVATCGAGTRRMTHWSPNTANIPKAKAKIKYGKECRELWSARPGRVLVGYDAKSLEMRMFCHYVNNPDVTALYLEGDPHARNASTLSDNPWGFVAERDTGAKGGFYAFLYGAQDHKLGTTIDPSRGNKEFGTWARGKLYESTPGLKELMETIQDEYYGNNGFLNCIDGGYVRCPSPHASLNYKCQSAGGLVMKQASIFLDEMANSLDHLKVGDIHDEGQHDVTQKDAEEFGKIAVKAIQAAGEELSFNLPLDGDYKIGENWAMTH